MYDFINYLERVEKLTTLSPSLPSLTFVAIKTVTKSKGDRLFVQQFGLAQNLNCLFLSYKSFHPHRAMLVLGAGAGGNPG